MPLKVKNKNVAELSSDVLKVPGDPLDDVADDARYGIYTFVTTDKKGNLYGTTTFQRLRRELRKPAGRISTGKRKHPTLIA